MLAGGVPTAVLMTAYEVVLHGQTLAPILAVPLVLFPLGGVFFGLSMWAWMESRWRKAEAERRTSLRKVF